jgi:hypothetical protein
MRGSKPEQTIKQKVTEAKQHRWSHRCQPTSQGVTATEELVACDKRYCAKARLARKQGQYQGRQCSPARNVTFAALWLSST